jgi:hypothetical protein
MEQLAVIQKKLDRAGRPQRLYKGAPVNATSNEIDLCCNGLDEDAVEGIRGEIEDDPDIVGTRVVPVDGHIHLYADCPLESPYEQARVERTYRNLVRDVQKSLSAGPDDLEE